MNEPLNATWIGNCLILPEHFNIIVIPKPFLLHYGTNIDIINDNEGHLIDKGNVFKTKFLFLIAVNSALFGIGLLQKLL